MTFWLFVCCYLTCCISLQFQFICTFLSFLCNDTQLCSCCSNSVVAVAVLFRAISSNPCATLTWSDQVSVAHGLLVHITMLNSISKLTFGITNQDLSSTFVQSG